MQKMAFFEVFCLRRAKKILTWLKNGLIDNFTSLGIYPENFSPREAKLAELLTFKVDVKRPKMAKNRCFFGNFGDPKATLRSYYSKLSQTIFLKMVLIDSK